MYERAKEHQSDREEKNDKSHKIKHWLTSHGCRNTLMVMWPWTLPAHAVALYDLGFSRARDHPELKSLPAFKFKIIQSFKDPMIRQLAEAVRIELRSNDILNAKGEYTIDIEFQDWRFIRKDEE